MKPDSAIIESNADTIFIVHGHDEELKQSVARFIEKGNLNVDILHEKPIIGSQHIFQRFKGYANNVGYAIILLTPDDLGKENNEQSELKTRARQNVVLEMGYFLGLLKEEKVLAIYKDIQELPSDYKGIIYLEYDERGAWKVELGKALKAAGLEFDLEKALS